MPWLFLLALIAFPVIEIALFIRVIDGIGLFWTILAAFGAGALGLSLLRRQGLTVMLRAKARLQSGDSPVQETLHGLFLAMAGFFFLLPGFFSDLLGLALLLPPVRTFLVAILAPKFQTGQERAHHQTPTPPTIETEYQVIDPKP